MIPLNQINHVSHGHPTSSNNLFQAGSQSHAARRRHADDMSVLICQRPPQSMTYFCIEQLAQFFNQIHFGKLRLGARFLQPVVGRCLVGCSLDTSVGSSTASFTFQRLLAVDQSASNTSSCRPAFLSRENLATTVDPRQANDKMMVSVPFAVRPPATSGMALPCGRAVHQPGCTLSRSRDLLCRVPTISGCLGIVFSGHLWRHATFLMRGQDDHRA